MIDYALLRVIWWVLLGVLLIGFAVMDGFDLGVASLLPFIAKNDDERRIVINTVGPVWEGNQVWFILGGGAIFAAWPMIYAVSFSGFYIAMFVVLLTFIVRPAGFKYRSKIKHPRWRYSWDYTLSIAAIVCAIVLGVAVGNVLQGVPFYFNDNLRSFYLGSFWQLLNPFALFCGVLSLLILLLQGSVYLVNKTTDALKKRATTLCKVLPYIIVLLFVLGGVWIAHLPGYVLVTHLNGEGASNPLYKTVVTQTGAWLLNYKSHGWFYAMPALGIVMPLLVSLCIKQLPRIAMICSSLGLFGIIATVGLSMFPFILPSSHDPKMSLLVWDASSSQLTLMIMTVVTAVFMPIILLYTTWVFRVLRGPVTTQTIDDNHQSY